jgi:hypothetical protein
VVTWAAVKGLVHMNVFIAGATCRQGIHGRHSGIHNRQGIHSGCYLQAQIALVDQATILPNIWVSCGGLVKTLLC